MGDILTGKSEDIAEEILAEEDEIGLFQKLFLQVNNFVSGYGWIVLIGAICTYFLWKKFNRNLALISHRNNEIDTSDFMKKEEARQRVIAQLQLKYQKESEIRAEKLKMMEEEKKKAKLAEMEKLIGKSGEKLGKGHKGQSSLRSDYNPLMGNGRNEDRACFRRGTGRSGG